MPRRKLTTQERTVKAIENARDWLDAMFHEGTPFEALRGAHEALAEARHIVRMTDPNFAAGYKAGDRVDLDLDETTEEPVEEDGPPVIISINTPLTL